MANSLEEIMQRRLKNYLQSSGTISGYVEDFDNLFTELEASGYSYSIRNSRPGVGIKFDSRKRDKAPEIKYFGCPFQTVKTTYYQCFLGHKYYNSQKDKQSDHPGSKKRRFHTKDTQKIGCNAWLTVKCVRVYDDFSISKTIFIESQARQKLTEALQSSSPPTGHLRFYIAASNDHSHSQMFSEKNMRIHPTLIKEIKKIVKSGVTSTTEIEIHLKQFVDNMFREDSAPNVTNKAFYPCKSVIYSHVYNVLYNEKTVGGTEILNENEEQQSMAPEEIASDSAIPTNNLERKRQDLRESAKKIIEMSYLCTVETGIKTAIEACNSACSTLAKCISSGSGLPSDSQKTGKTNTGLQTPR